MEIKDAPTVHQCWSGAGHTQKEISSNQRPQGVSEIHQCGVKDTAATPPARLHRNIWGNKQEGYLRNQPGTAAEQWL